MAKGVARPRARDVAEVRVGVGPYSVRLEASPARYLVALQATVGTAAPPSDAPALEFVLRRRADDGFELRHPAGVKRVRSPWSLGSLIQGLLLSALGARARDALHLHAAALTTPAGGAVLLPAVSGTGKSTAALALAAAGWRCCSDDLSFWEPAGGQVHGTDFAIALKTEPPPALGSQLTGWSRHALRFRDVQGRFGSRQTWHAPPTDLPWRAPLRAVGFLVRRPGPPAVVELSAGAALSRLWPLRVDGGPVDLDPREFSPTEIAHALAGVRCAEICTGRVEDVVPTVHAWLGARGPAA